jgi:hypothetical protein
MTKEDEDTGCISPDDVGCPDMRKYLQKHGMLCGVKPPKNPKPVPPKVGEFLKKWIRKNPAAGAGPGKPPVPARHDFRRKEKGVLQRIVDEWF